MAVPLPSCRARADHYRELALWTNDEWTQHILLDMASELDAEAADSSAPPPEDASAPLRALS